MKRRKAVNAVKWAFGLLVAVVWIFPFYWMIVTSLKPESYILASVSLVPEVFTVQHYVTVFTKAPMVRWFANSIIVSVVVTLARLAVSSMAGYALARMRFVGRTVIYLAFLGSLMIPDEISIVPLFIWEIGRAHV